MAAVAACGAPTGNGNGDGQILAAESILAWEHLSKAGFINGTYTCAAADGPTTTPVNAYNIYLQLIYDNAWGLVAAGTNRHNLKTGPGIPVAVIAELDRKVDDGLPYTGTFQFSLWASNGAAPAAPAATSCTTTAAVASTWNANNGNTNCGGSTLF